MNLKEMWKKYLELRNEADKLWNETYKLYEEGARLSVLDEKSHTYMELSIKANRLWNKARKLYYGFINENYGKGIKTKYWHGRRILSNGVILYSDGNVYEPLEVVMKKIIKDHEEKNDS